MASGRGGGARRCRSPDAVPGRAAAAAAALEVQLDGRGDRGKPRSATGQPSVYQISVRILAEDRAFWLAAAGEGSLATRIRAP